MLMPEVGNPDACAPRSHASLSGQGLPEYVSPWRRDRENQSWHWAPMNSTKMDICAKIIEVMKGLPSHYAHTSTSLCFQLSYFHWCGIKKAQLSAAGYCLYSCLHRSPAFLQNRESSGPPSPPLLKEWIPNDFGICFEAWSFLILTWVGGRTRGSEQSQELALDLSPRDPTWTPGSSILCLTLGSLPSPPPSLPHDHCYHWLGKRKNKNLFTISSYTWTWRLVRSPIDLPLPVTDTMVFQVDCGSLHKFEWSPFNSTKTPSIIRAL